MKLIIYSGNVDTVRDAMMVDVVRRKTLSNIELEDVSEAVKKDASVLKMKAFEASFFSDYIIYTLYDTTATVNDAAWDKIVEICSTDDNAGVKIVGTDFVNDSGENVLCISVKSIPAKYKKKLEAAGICNIVQCSGKTPQDTGKLFLDSVPNFPVRAQGQMLGKVGREVQLLPLMVSDLRSKYGDNFDGLQVSSIVEETGSVDIQKAPWDLTDSMDANQVSEALRLARILSTTKFGHVGVVSLIRNHYAQMHRVWGTGLNDEKKIATILGHKGSTYPLKKALNMSRKYGDKLPVMVKLCDDAYVDLTGGSMLNKDIILDILVSRLAAM